MKSKAYYNENDLFAAAWLRELIKEGLIADGEIDTRSIADVRADDLKGFIRCHFFAGIGGWDYALQLAGWPDDRPVWTGSCPCQPFSLAGARQGFDDSRHLWPQFARLIRDAGPATIFGEQVASATDWLGLVRGDLDAMGYAVGAMPVEAASAGADHLRDRFWFVGDRSRVGSGMVNTTRIGRREGQPEPEFRRGRSTASCTSGVGLADADNARSQGRTTKSERADQRIAGPHGLAHADISGPGERRQQRSGEQRGIGGDPRTRIGRDVADSNIAGECRLTGKESGAPRACEGEVEGHFRQRDGLLDFGTRDDGGNNSLAHSDRAERRPQPEGRYVDDGHDAGRQEASGGYSIHREEYEWVIGADGKARRVKSGIRLLVNGVSGRVAVRCPGQPGATEIQEHWYNRIGALKGFGNAIDPRPASEFIAAFLETEVTP